jgi:crotonobetaine/carnitine-CoA ligase
MAGTVFEAFVDTRATHPAHPFVMLPARADRAWWPDGLIRSYDEVLSDALALIPRYQAAGYGHGHRVALLFETRPEFWPHYLALNALGIGIVPINPDYRHDELVYLIEHSEAALVLVVPGRIADLERAVAATDAKPNVIDLIDLPPSLPPARTPPPNRKDPDHATECALLYTSGTTGRPKGCILTNFYFLNAGRSYLAHGGAMTIRRGLDRIYNPLPLYHMNHLTVSATGAILSANTVIVPERFSPKRWWREVCDTGATIIHYLGIVAPVLMNEAPGPLDRAHRVRFGLGAGIEPQLHGAFEERFGFPMIEVWGMTETGRVFADAHEPRSITTRAFGRPNAEMQARVVDDQDRDVPVGTPGELIVRHSAEAPRHGFFSGYLKNEVATEEAWRGGWFHTGDVVTQDASGMLTFLDRKKHIVRRSGENIAAAEIEAVLQAHGDVAQVAVIAAPDEIRDEEVFACVVPMPGVEPSPKLADALFAWANARLAYYKTPGWILFVETLPTTGTQKVQKTQIFATGEDPRQRAGAIDLRARKVRTA